MNQIAAIFLLLLLASCSNQKPGTDIPVVTAQDEESLRYLKEVEWPKAYHQQDSVLLDRILGEDFQMVDASGNWTNKADEMDWIRNNEYAPDSFYYEIKRLDIYDNGTAIIAGTGHIINNSIETVYESSNVLVKRDGEWKAVLSHVSGIKSMD